MLNFIKEQDKHDVIDKIYLYARDLNKPKYQFLIEKREDSGINIIIIMIQMHLSSVQILWMMFIRISMIKIQSRKEKKLIVFDEMIVDIMTT